VAVTEPAPVASATATVAGHRLDRSTIPLLVTLGLGVFAGALDLGVLSPALPALGAAFGVGPRDLAWVFTLYLLANVVAIPVMTKLADRYGRRPIYVLCVSVFAAGSVLAIAAPTFAIFLVARAIQAAGAGGIFPVATAAIADRIPMERRGAALGLVAATWGLAAVIGPVIGGLITHYVSWHWVFALNVPLAIVVIAMARTTVPKTIANVRGPLDVKTVNGSITITLPPGNGFTLDAKTLTGGISADGITVERPRYGPGAHASGTSGDGARRVTLETVNGSITVTR